MAVLVFPPPLILLATIALLVVVLAPIVLDDYRAMRQDGDR